MWLAFAVAAEPEITALDRYRCEHLYAEQRVEIGDYKSPIRVFRAWRGLKVDEFAKLVGDDATIRRLKRRVTNWGIVAIPTAVAGVGLISFGLFDLGKKRPKGWKEAGLGVGLTTASAVLTRSMIGGNTTYTRYYSDADVQGWIDHYNAGVRGGYGLDQAGTLEVDDADRRVRKSVAFGNCR